MTTLKQVAEHAGVSFKTVSRVLNGDPNVSPDTRAKVQDSIKALDYRPNMAARSMRTGKSQIIGFITDEVATGPFAGNIIKGAQHEAWQHEKLLFVVNTESDPKIEQKAIAMMLERRVEGILYGTWYHREATPPAMLSEIPTVLVDCFVSDQSLPSVVPDEVRGGREATTALLEKGHRRIGFLNDGNPVPASKGRLMGYQQALANFGVAYDESLVVLGSGNASGGYDCALNLLQREDRPTAIFCFNDRMAMGAYDAIRKLGLRIPKDIAVIGFDNQEIIAAQLHPTLSSMQLPHYEMGQWAVRYLIDCADETGNLQPIQHYIECPLIERQSTG